MSPSAPIGVFDSGLGGLSVLHEIRQLMPHESLCYIADSHYAPYGEKPHTLICQRSIVCVDWLIEQGAKAIVVACNTATAAAIGPLRARYTLPIIAMEPAIKPAGEITRTGRVGVLATAGTLSSKKYESLLRQHARHISVISQACPGLVEVIESGDFSSVALRELLDQYLAPLRQAQIDTLILGCTHYPLIRSLITERAGEGVAVVESGSAVARRLQQQLAERDLLNLQAKPSPLRCWSSGELPTQQSLLQSVWGAPLLLHALPTFSYS